MQKIAQLQTRKNTGHGKLIQLEATARDRGGAAATALAEDPSAEIPPSREEELKTLRAELVAIDNLLWLDVCHCHVRMPLSCFLGPLPDNGTRTVSLRLAQLGG